MAAVTLLGTPTFNSTGGNKTVTATPAVGDLIVIIAAVTSDPTPSVSDNQGGSYSADVEAFKNASGDTQAIYVRTTLISSAVSTIFTMTSAGGDNGGGLAVLKVTGMSRAGASAIRQAAKQDNQAAAGTPAPVFPAAALTANPIIGSVHNASSPAGITPRSSPAYTERFDNGYSVPTTGLEIMSIDSGETASTITWGGSSATAFSSIAIELDTSSPPAATPRSFGVIF